jgi:predicted type IV restriction endonuclease
MTTPEATYIEIAQLVQRSRSLSASEHKAMNEHATRQGYIMPLFCSLGWNVENFNEVSPEEKVSRGWVDFSYRIGGIPRYFLETKRASEDLNEPRWVQQAIDYAWTKSVTWALLSDFEGLQILNTEWKETNLIKKSAHDEIVNLVQEMLDLQKQHQQAEAAKEDARFALQKRIQELDQAIDARVYRLYGLTEAEIKIVVAG